jgi:predicted dienelactone hydrolase
LNFFSIPLFSFLPLLRDIMSPLSSFSFCAVGRFGLKRWFAVFTLPVFLLFQPTPASATSYSVGSTNITLHDAARNRDVPLKIYYPQTAGPNRFPILIFSHGAGGSKDGYAYLSRYWAAHGYVVLNPTHLGSDRSLLKKGRSFYNLRVVKKMVNEKANLVNRPKDITFLLDCLPQLEERVPLLKGHMDPTRIGVGGHSFGAYTSMAVAGAKVYASSDKPLGFEDTRIEAFLVLSPQGPGGWAFKGDSWDQVHRPMFMMTGTQDRGLENGEPYQWRLKAFEHLRSGHKYLAVIQGANHMDFADTQFNGKVRDSRVHEWIKRASLQFWDAYVKGDRGLEQTLKQGGFLKVSGVRVETESK